MDSFRWRVIQSIARKLKKRGVVVPLSGFELHYDAEKEPYRVLIFTPTENVYMGECVLTSAMTTSEFSRAGNEIKSELTPDTDVMGLIEVLNDFGYPVTLYDPPKRTPPPYTGQREKMAPPAEKKPPEVVEEL